MRTPPEMNPPPAALELEPELLALLDERARELARPLDRAEDHERGDLYVRFDIGSTRFALDSECVVRVLARPKVSRIPFAPRHLAHVIHAEGRVVSVADPLCLLDGSGASHVRDAVLLLEWERARLGLFVDAVVGLHRIVAASVVGAEATRERRGVVEGTAPGMVVVLDARRMVSDAATLGSSA